MISPLLCAAPRGKVCWWRHGEADGQRGERGEDGSLFETCYPILRVSFFGMKILLQREEIHTMTGSSSPSGDQTPDVRMTLNRLEAAVPDPSGSQSGDGASPPQDPSAPGRSGGGRRAPRECGPLGLRIGADGTWFFQGSPIGRKELVKLFSTVLSRDDQGVYWMTTPAEHGTVEVDDAPFVAVELDVSGTGPDQIIRFRTNVDDWIEVDADHPLRVEEDPETGQPSPYVYVRRGLDAKIARSVFYDLVERGVPAPDSIMEDGKDGIGVWSKGRFFLLGTL